MVGKMVEEATVRLWYVDPQAQALEQVDAHPRDTEGKMFFVSSVGTCWKGYQLFETKQAAIKSAVKTLRQLIDTLETKLEWFEEQ